MATITVNEVAFEVQEGMSLLQALLDLGIFVPHFCYHPDLPVDGNCRQCLVEIDSPNGPMGVISCATPVADGMVVRTNTPAMEKTRRGVLEYLLLNHPVDCPVCDQAGECRLQQYYMTYGFHQTRVAVEKVKKNKRVTLGPRVMLDQERCVLCRRCVRFTAHVTGTNELTVAGRGDHSFITTFPGQELDNPYSVNTVDVCPVGALTDRDFRFRCRVWYLKQTDTVCPGCARGCSAILDTYYHTTMDGQNGTAFRLRPRRNPEVNKSWMCDEGRLLYKTVNENRVKAPLVRAENTLRITSWEEALGSAAERLCTAGPAGTAGIASPDCSNEEIMLFRYFLSEVVGSEAMSAESLRPPGDQDDILLRADRHPNSLGAQLLGPWSTLEALLDSIQAGKTRVLIILRNDLLGDCAGTDAARKALESLDCMVVIDSHMTETAKAAGVVLPCGTFAEREGTLVNFRGRIQRTFRACPPRWDAKDVFDIINALADALGRPMEDIENPGAAWERFADRVDAFSGTRYTQIGRTGLSLPGYEDAPAESRLFTVE